MTQYDVMAASSLHLAWLCAIVAGFSPLQARAQVVSPEVFTRADDGDLDAQITLAGCYGSGLGVPRNLALSAKWLGRAAEQGHPESQYRFGGLHYAPANASVGLPIDHSVAAEWFRRAAVQGHKWAQFSLGLAYAKGLGVAKDDGQAAQWYLKAASQGVEQAQHAVGRAFVAGCGLLRDPAQAATWYRLAADRGHLAAQLDLIDMYQKGEGVPKDEAEACAWLSIVAADHPGFRPRFQRLYDGLPPDSRKLVQARADILRKEIEARGSSSAR
ncbi:MAG: tetratricopeptide repeat protein [Verrucomicrobiota bacterium]